MDAAGTLANRGDEMMTCGCRIETNELHHTRQIVYCALHAAAEAMREALQEILPSLEHERVHNGDGYDCQGWRAETVDACTCRVLKVQQALAHAEATT